MRLRPTALAGRCLMAGVITMTASLAAVADEAAEETPPTPTLTLQAAYMGEIWGVDGGNSRMWYWQRPR